MKTRHSITAALFLTTLTLASPAAAQNTPGSESTVLLGLTLVTATPDVLRRTPEGDLVLDEDDKPVLDYGTSYATVKNGIRTDVLETGNKLKIEKYGNKEFLTDLLEKGGYFPGGETSIKGWVLKQVEGGGFTNVYLMKKGVPAVRLPDNLIRVSFSQAQTSGKIIRKVSGPVDGVYGKPTIAGSVKVKGYSTLSVSLPDKLGLAVQGFAVGTLKAGQPDVSEVGVGGSIPFFVNLFAIKASGILGNGGKSTGPFTVEGTFSLSSPLFVPDVYALPNFGGN